MRLVRALLCLAILGVSTARAQAPQLFGSGQPQVTYEDKLDARFETTKVAKALAAGPESPECARLLGGLLLLLGEAAPRIHGVDQNFWLETPLIQALRAQLTLPRFPATDYLQMMFRQVLIKKKLPAGWYATAEAISKGMPSIDLGKLKMLDDGEPPIDSFYATLPALIERHHVEVDQANSTVSARAEDAFLDAYRDHKIAWGDLTFVDVQLAAKGGKARGAGKQKRHPESGDGYLARLEWHRPEEKKNMVHPLPFLQTEKKDPGWVIEAHLRPKQYLELAKLPRGTRVLVRGVATGWNAGFRHIVVGDALLFEDRDFSHGIELASPALVAECPLATNDLHGLAPNQPGGFAH